MYFIDDSANKDPETVLQEMIALRAYCLWQERGSPLGSPEDDWFRAEQEIRIRLAQVKQTGDNPAAQVRAEAA